MLNIVYNCNMKSSFCRPLPTVETTMKVEMPLLLYYIWAYTSLVTSQCIIKEIRKTGSN